MSSLTKDYKTFKKNNKSSGSDDFWSEFFKIFWTQIKKIVKRSVNYSYNIGALSLIQRQCIIT